MNIKQFINLRGSCPFCKVPLVLYDSKNAKEFIRNNETYYLLDLYRGLNIVDLFLMDNEDGINCSIKFKKEANTYTNLFFIISLFCNSCKNYKITSKTISLNLRGVNDKISLTFYGESFKLISDKGEYYLSNKVKDLTRVVVMPFNDSSHAAFDIPEISFLYDNDPDINNLINKIDKLILIS